MDVTPLIPADRQYINRYSETGFVVSRVAHEGPVLVFPDRTIAWTGVEAGAGWERRLTLDSFVQVLETAPPVEILLLGCGARMALIPGALKRSVRDAGPILEAMDTGAACRTYNVLLSEERRVAAALLPTG